MFKFFAIVLRYVGELESNWFPKGGQELAEEVVEKYPKRSAICCPAGVWTPVMEKDATDSEDEDEEEDAEVKAVVEEDDEDDEDETRVPSIFSLVSTGSPAALIATSTWLNSIDDDAEEDAEVKAVVEEDDEDDEDESRVPSIFSLISTGSPTASISASTWLKSIISIESSILTLFLLFFFFIF